MVCMIIVILDLSAILTIPPTQKSKIKVVAKKINILWMSIFELFLIEIC